MYSIDEQVLRENFDDEDINRLDINNVNLIFDYLIENGVYYAKDIFISSMDLFLLPNEEFVKRFEVLKKELGDDYIDLLACDASLIEIMYR